MAKIWVTEYEVIGDGQFPVDMLRYDASYPADDQSAAAILAEAGFGMKPLKREPRRVTLRHRDSYSKWEPTVGRWNSFSWSLDMANVRTWSI